MSTSVFTAGSKCYLVICIVLSVFSEYVLLQNTTFPPTQAQNHNQHVAKSYGWTQNRHNSSAPSYGWVTKKTTTTTTRRPQPTRPPPTNYPPTVRPPTRPVTHLPKPSRHNNTHVRPPKVHPTVNNTPPTIRPSHRPIVIHTPPTRPTYRPSPPTRPTYRPPHPTQHTPTRRPQTAKPRPSMRPPVKKVDPKEHLKWQINYTIQKIDHKYDYASEYLNNDRIGSFLLEKLNTLNPASYLEATKLPHRPYYDHYRVYYNGSRFSTTNLQTEIPVNQIDVCQGGSQILCPNGTHALCMNAGKILCLGSKTNTLPCGRFPENPPPHVDMLDIVSPMVFDRSPYHTCVDTWSIPCYRFTKNIDQCRYKDSSHKTLLRLRCLFNTTVTGSFEIVNNTIIPTNKIRNNSVTTTPPSSLWNRPIRQSFCVVVLAEPRLSEFHKGNNLLLPGAENLFSKFAIKAFDPYNIVPYID